MRKPLFLGCVVGSLALLSFAEAAQAQIRIGVGGWGGGRSGFSYGRGYGRGYGYYGDYGYYGRPYRGYYGSPRYYGSQPYYLTPDYVMEPSSQTTQSFYPESDRRAHIRVMVPNPQAQVWFDDTPMDQQGTERVYVTPDLREGVTHSYNIKAAWQQGGQEISRVKKVEFRAGDFVTVAFGSRDAADDTQPPSRERLRNPTERSEPRIDVDLKSRAEDRDRDLRTEEKATLKAKSSAMSGKLVRVERDEFIMTDKDGSNRHSHRLAPDAKIIINGRDGRLEDLTPGAEIKVTMKEGETDMAAKIEVTGKGISKQKEDVSEPQPPE